MGGGFRRAVGEARATEWACLGGFNHPQPTPIGGARPPPYTIERNVEEEGRPPAVWWCGVVRRALSSAVRRAVVVRRVVVWWSSAVCCWGWSAEAPHIVSASAWRVPGAQPRPLWKWECPPEEVSAS